MTPTLADATVVRTAGGLLSESFGGATDAQINASLAIAQRHMKNLLTKAVYLIVSAYDNSSTDQEKEKKEAFLQAEARLGIAYLPVILTNTQLQQTGFKSEAEIGRARTKFGPGDENDIISDFWISEAMLLLSPYQDKSYFDQATGQEYGFESDDQSFTMLSI
jgi:hypothetical protein